jgi:hypothetical protein
VWSARTLLAMNPMYGFPAVRISLPFVTLPSLVGRLCSQRPENLEVVFRTVTKGSSASHGPQLWTTLSVVDARGCTLASIGYSGLSFSPYSSLYRAAGVTDAAALAAIQLHEAENVTTVLSACTGADPFPLVAPGSVVSLQRLSSSIAIDTANRSGLVWQTSVFGAAQSGNPGFAAGSAGGSSSHSVQIVHVTFFIRIRVASEDDSLADLEPGFAVDCDRMAGLWDPLLVGPQPDHLEQTEIATTRMQKLEVRYSQLRSIISMSQRQGFLPRLDEGEGQVQQAAKKCQDLFAAAAKDATGGGGAGGAGSGSSSAGSSGGAGLSAAMELVKQVAGENTSVVALINSLQPPATDEAVADGRYS